MALGLSSAALMGIRHYETYWMQQVQQQLPVPIETLAQRSDWQIEDDARVGLALVAGMMVDEQHKYARVNPSLTPQLRRLALAWLVAWKLDGGRDCYVVEPMGVRTTCRSAEGRRIARITSHLLIPEPVFRESWSLAQLQQICQVPDWVIFSRFIGSNPEANRRYLSAEPTEWQTIHWHCCCS